MKTRHCCDKIPPAQCPPNYKRPTAHEWTYLGIDARHMPDTGDTVDMHIYVCFRFDPIKGDVCGKERMSSHAPPQPPLIKRCWYLIKRLTWAGKLLIDVRKALPWPARIMAFVAMPFTLMVGIPDLGIDEALWAAVALIVWFTRRELLRAVWIEAGQPYVPYK